MFQEHGLSAFSAYRNLGRDADSAAMKRLRGLGLNVIEAARANPSTTALDSTQFVNHGGLTVITMPGVSIAKIDTGLDAADF